MFTIISNIAGFLLGLGMTVGLLLAPHMFPWGYRWGLTWSLSTLVLWIVGGMAILIAVLWMSGRLMKGAQSWKESRVLISAILVAGTANLLYSMMIELFGMGMGLRALIAVLGVPVIYGNMVAVLRKQSLPKTLGTIFFGALATMGAGFIVVALFKGL